MPGKRNSSLTRVQPLFRALLDRDATGANWLPAFLRLTVRSGALPPSVAESPGELLKQGEEVFEHRVPPPEEFLAWLITHPEHLSWPKRKGVPICFGEQAQEWRCRLIHRRGAARARAIRDGLAELASVGAAGSRGRGWAFEGFTSVDCCLETERLLLFIEGKRTETLSPSTAWYPDRNQLVRNLEAIAAPARGRTCGVVLLAEEPMAGLSDRSLKRGLPHLDDKERQEVAARYLGQARWAQLYEAFSVELPRELPDRGDAASGECA